jgi:hypothetical protein
MVFAEVKAVDKNQAALLLPTAYVFIPSQRRSTLTFASSLIFIRVIRE